jgi:hypothetical protein
LRHAVHERYARGLLEIDRDAVFRIVEEGEAAAAVVAGTIVLERWILNAESVGTLFRFDMDGVGAEIAQHLADMRPGGIAAELQHLETGERLGDRGHGWPPARSLRVEANAVAAATVGARSDVGTTRATAMFDAATEEGSRGNGAAGAWRNGGRSPSITAKLPEKRSALPGAVWKKPRASSCGSVAISATVATG